MEELIKQAKDLGILLLDSENKEDLSLKKLKSEKLKVVLFALEEVLKNPEVFVSEDEVYLKDVISLQKITKGRGSFLKGYLNLDYDEKVYINTGDDNYQDSWDTQQFDKVVEPALQKRILQDIIKIKKSLE